MTAVTRWVEYSIDEAGETSVASQNLGGVGQRGYAPADEAEDKDLFDIGAGNRKLYVNIDGDNSGTYILLASGTELDPRFVARDITEKLHNLQKTGQYETSYNFASCEWVNNRLRLYSGTLGQDSSVAVVSGTDTAHLELGWGTYSPVNGTNDNLTGYGNNNMGGISDNGYDGGILVSGTYNGFFDEEYTIVATNEATIGAVQKGSSNGYTGTITAGGIFNFSQDVTYEVYIATEPGTTQRGTTMGGGIGNVPQMTWTSSDSNNDPSPYPVDLLYPNYWYRVGTRGLMVKFTDAVFSHCPDTANYAFRIACTKATTVYLSNPFAAPGSGLRYGWGSNRGDDSGATTVESAALGSTSRLGSRGLEIGFTSSDGVYATNEFRVLCRPPQPKSYDITNLNYGNVTVSTEAPVKCVIFEIKSGAIEMSTVKFGLQSHGTFEHHNENTGDTYFRFGTVGPGNPAGSSPTNGIEWWPNVTSPDHIGSDTNPSFLYATRENLDVVSDADDSEAIGSSGYMGMTSDPIWLNIKLGNAEVGANSTINYRIFFDYS
jgi:hypothetical protein